MLQLVTVVVACFEGQKTRPDQTLKHYDKAVLTLAIAYCITDLIAFMNPETICYMQVLRASALALPDVKLTRRRATD